MESVLRFVESYPEISLLIATALITVLFRLIQKAEAKYPRLQAVMDLVRAMGFNLTGALEASQRLISGRARRQIVLDPTMRAALDAAVSGLDTPASKPVSPAPPSVTP